MKGVRSAVRAQRRTTGERERDLGDLEDRHEGAAGHSASD